MRPLHFLVTSMLKNAQETHPSVSPFIKGDFKAAIGRHLMATMGQGAFPPPFEKGDRGGFDPIIQNLLKGIQIDCQADHCFLLFAST